MFKNYISSLLIAIILTACSNFSSTPTPTLPPTATIEPFSALNLDDLIVQNYDLPSGVSGAQIGYNEERAKSIPVAADYYIEQELAYKDNKRGEVQIWIYEDTVNTMLRYNERLDLFDQECAKAEHQCYPEDPKVIPDLGESAMMIDVYNYIGPDNFTITFLRCNAVVEINIWAVTTDPNDVITYAQRLDKRLSEVVCRDSSN